MKDTPKTFLFIAASVILSVVAYTTRPQIETDKVFADLGAEFYSEFKDASNAAELEITGVDDLTKQLIPFKVEVKNGRWVLPAYSDYPSDVEDKVEKFAANLIGLKKDVLRSNLPDAHESLGVVDPAKNSATEGKGVRVTLRSKSGSVLCDYIFGETVEGKEGYRFVRIPGQPNTYETKVNLSISTKFSDWVKTGLLKMESGDAVGLMSLDYSFTQGKRVLNDKYELLKTDGKWQSSEKVPEGKELDDSKISEIISALADLKLAGVRKKPESLIDLLNGKGQGVTQQADFSLRSKGFYIQQGTLVGDEGQFVLTKSNGIMYNILFGVSFKDDSIQIQGSGDDKKEKDSGRYMFLMASFDETLNQEPKILEAPAKLKEDASEDEKKKHQEVMAKYEASVKEHEEWQNSKKEAMEELETLQKKFNDWFYVIADETYSKVKLQLKDLLKDEEKAKKEDNSGDNLPDFHPKLPGLPK